MFNKSTNIEVQAATKIGQGISAKDTHDLNLETIRACIHTYFMHFHRVDSFVAHCTRIWHSYINLAWVLSKRNG